MTAEEHSGDPHLYMHPGPFASRSPCPALNTLANHGYLPRDGRALTLTQLVTAIQTVYGLSRTVAFIPAFLALAACGYWSWHPSSSSPSSRSSILPTRVVDLHALARHSGMFALEHDASLVHVDAPDGQTPFASTIVDSVLLTQLLHAAPEGCETLSLEDLCEAQVARRAAARPLGMREALAARTELALICEVLGTREEKRPAGGESGIHVPKVFLEQWLEEERLPDGWRAPEREVGLVRVLGRVREIGKIEGKLREQGD